MYFLPACQTHVTIESHTRPTSSRTAYSQLFVKTHAQSHTVQGARAKHAIRSVQAFAAHQKVAKKKKQTRWPFA